MSDVMLQGVLCMPPELWRDSPLDVNQRYQRYLQASRRIENDSREIEQLRTALNEIARHTGSDDPCRKLVDIARNALQSEKAKIDAPET